MRILLATDGSAGALAAARLLASLPLEADADVTVLFIAREADGPAERSHVAEARALLSHCTGSVSGVIRHGDPADQIVHAAEERPADLIALGASGHTGIARFLVGSVAERVARHAPCPVLLARPGADGLREVVVGLDWSDSAARAAEWLRGFPLPPEAEVRLVMAIPLLESWTRQRMSMLPPLVDDPTTLDRKEREEAHRRLDAFAARFEAAGCRVVTEIRSGDAATALLQVVADEGADLLVVGSHGLNAMERFLLGSVSQNVLRHAPCSVLVVRAR